MSFTLGPLFVVAPRYARDLGASLADRGFAARIVAQTDGAAMALARSDATIAIVDARGAMASSLLAAHEIGAVIAARRGAMLVLLQRGDPGGTAAARAAGASHVLASPFTGAELAETLGFAGDMVARLAAATTGAPAADAGEVHRDRLTGLANAHHAGIRLAGLLDDEAAPAVLLIGVGRFASINAAHGQAAADALLQAVAERLMRVVAETGAGGERLVARMAGAEFAVLLPPGTAETAPALARAIVAAFETPFASNARIVHLRVRIGIAVAAPGTTPERLFRQAASALAAARAGSPGGIELYAAAGDDALGRLADLESDMRLAIADDRFDIAYQPQVAIASGRIVGVEALVRWRHPEFGLLPAETLLEVAAGGEFAAELNAYILGKATREAAAWPAALATLSLSVNVSAGDLRAGGFADAVVAILAASGFPASRLMLEVTESDLIENLDAAAATLAALRAHGIGVALDDFGTGYSSLAYLKSLPLDALKLDRRLTRDLGGSSRDRVVVRVIVALARALGIRVVAEGVETEAELAMVAAARCDWYQGFHCATAMPARDLGRFVGDWNDGIDQPPLVALTA